MSTTTIVKSGNQIINITTNELNQKLVSVSQAANESPTTTTTTTTMQNETSTGSPPTTLSCDLLGDTNGSFNSSSLNADAALGYSSNAQYTTLVDLGSSLFGSIDCDTSSYYGAAPASFNHQNSEYTYMQQASSSSSNLLTPSSDLVNQAKLTTFTLCSPSKNIIDDLQQQQQYQQIQFNTNFKQHQHLQLQQQQPVYFMHQETSFDCDSSLNEYENHQASHIAQASPVTTRWLLENFEPAEGCSLRRSTLYNYYLHHCTEQRLEPVNPASFGKLIRSVYCNLRTRRLGTRGNSKYHYYGIRVQASSLLNHLADEDFTAIKNHPMSLSPTGSPQKPLGTTSKHGASFESPSKRVKLANSSSSSFTTATYDNMNSPVEYKPVINENMPDYNSSSSSSNDKKPLLTTVKSFKQAKSKVSHLGENQSVLNNNTNTTSESLEDDFNLMIQSGTMPQMPELNSIQISSHLTELPLDLNEDDVKTFESLYKDHLESMFHCILKLKFSEIEHLWHQFWRSNIMTTSSLESQLTSSKLVSLLSVPQVSEFVRDSDTRFYQFCIEVLIPDVLDSSKKDLVIVMRNFCRSFNVWSPTTLANVPDSFRELKLKLIRSFCLLVKQYSNLVWLISAFKSSLKTENQNLVTVGHDFNKIDFNYISEQMVWMCGCDKQFVEKYVKGFKELFVPESTMSDWFNWLNNLVTSYLKPYETSETYNKMAKKLYSSWSLISSCAFKDLTLRSAKTFGNIVFFQMVLDEYMLYLIQQLMAKHSNMRVLELINSVEYSSANFKSSSDSNLTN